jgi:lysophospholipase L1-like esterase
MRRRSFLLSLLVAPNIFAEESKPNLLIGDSLAYMLARPLRIASKKHGQILRDTSRGGTNTNQWITKGWFRQALSDFKPKTVLVSLGVNDWGVKVNREAFPKNAKKIVNIAHKQNVEIVWLLPPKLNPKKVKTDFIKSGVEQSGADRWHDASKLDMELFDGIHPTFKSLSVWAEDLSKYLYG